MMKAVLPYFLASYDPSIKGSTADFWVWHHHSLSLDLLNRAYYDYAFHHRPDNPLKLRSRDYHGGCATVNDTWVCWYRFLNAGRDTRTVGSGRWVLTCAFVRRKDVRRDQHRYDCSGLLFTDEMSTV